jgi:hypothetical protein
MTWEMGESGAGKGLKCKMAREASATNEWSWVSFPFGLRAGLRAQGLWREGAQPRCHQRGYSSAGYSSAEGIIAVVQRHDVGDHGFQGGFVLDVLGGDDHF